MGGTFGSSLQSSGHHFLDLGVVHLPGGSRARLIKKSLDAAFQKTFAPKSHRRVGGAQPACHIAIAATLAAFENDLRAKGDAARTASLPRELLELLFVCGRNADSFGRTSNHPRSVQPLPFF